MRRAILINDTSGENHVGSAQVIKNIKRLCLENKIDLRATFTRKEINENDSRLKSQLHHSDLNIVNGEGSLHHSTNWFYTLLKLLPNSKNVLINSIWQDMYFNNYDYLDKFDIISLRESKSYEALNEIYDFSGRNIVVTPDMIFNTDFCQKNIGYGDSVMSSIKMSVENLDNYYPLSYNHDNTPDIHAYVSWLKNQKLYITGRFHGVCLASMCKTPFLAFPSNAHKIEGILKDMNCEELLIKDFKDINNKHKIAQKSIKKAYTYALNAKVKIKELFKNIGAL